MSHFIIELALGEGISKVQKILKSYTDGTFTQWLTSTLGSKQTGYNYLSYYELYQALPSPDLQDSFSKIPQKAAYTLANKSKGGDIEKTIDIINGYHDRPLDEIIQVVREAFPVKEGDKRKRSNKISEKTFVRDTLKMTGHLADRKSLVKLRNRANELLEEKFSSLIEEDPNQLDWVEKAPHTD